MTATKLEPRLTEVADGWRTGARVRNLAPLAGGASSVTFTGEVVIGDAATEIVVKVAPPGLDPTGNRDVLRESRILQVISAARTAPVPTVLFEDAGEPPLVPPLFAMTRVPGDSLEPLFDLDPSPLDPGVEPWPTPEWLIPARAHHASSILAHLQATDLAISALGQEPFVGIADEVARWAAALATVNPPFAPGWDRCRDALLAQVPAPVRPTVAHGDYRLGNMLSRGGRIEALIDWEIWNVGDPRLDLAWFRLNGDPDAYRRRTAAAACMPHPDALLESYANAAGGTPEDLVWFDALARFKSVATWSLILKHLRRAGKAEYADVEAALARLLAAAQRLLG